MFEVPTNDFLLAALQTVASTYVYSVSTTCKIHLAKAPFTPSRVLDVTTLTEADFTGYVAKIVGMPGAAFIDSIGQAKIIGGNVVTWEATDAVNPNTIAGYWIMTVETVPRLMSSALFDAPIPMTLAGAVLSVVWEFAYAAWQSQIQQLAP